MWHVRVSWCVAVGLHVCVCVCVSVSSHLLWQEWNELGTNHVQPFGDLRLWIYEGRMRDKWKASNKLLFLFSLLYIIKHNTYTPTIKYAMQLHFSTDSLLPKVLFWNLIYKKDPNMMHKCNLLPPHAQTKLVNISFLHIWLMLIVAQRLKYSCPASAAPHQPRGAPPPSASSLSGGQWSCPIELICSLRRRWVAKRNLFLDHCNHLPASQTRAPSANGMHACILVYFAGR